MSSYLELERRKLFWKKLSLHPLLFWWSFESNCKSNQASKIFFLLFSSAFNFFLGGFSTFRLSNWSKLSTHWTKNAFYKPFPSHSLSVWSITSRTTLICTWSLNMYPVVKCFHIFAKSGASGKWLLFFWYRKSNKEKHQ